MRQPGELFQIADWKQARRYPCHSPVQYSRAVAFGNRNSSSLIQFPRGKEITYFGFVTDEGI